jgi:hypothetical protein
VREQLCIDYIIKCRQCCIFRGGRDILKILRLFSWLKILLTLAASERRCIYVIHILTLITEIMRALKSSHLCLALPNSILLLGLQNTFLCMFIMSLSSIMFRLFYCLWFDNCNQFRRCSSRFATNFALLACVKKPQLHLWNAIPFFPSSTFYSTHS